MTTFREAPTTAARPFAACLIATLTLGVTVGVASGGPAVTTSRAEHSLTPVARLNLETYARLRIAEAPAPNPVETPAPKPEAAPRATFGLPRPNPSRGVAEVPVTLAAPAEVRAMLFDAQGRRIRELSEGTMGAGSQIVRWDGRTSTGAPAASGIYWLRVRAGDQEKTIRLAITR